MIFGTFSPLIHCARRSWRDVVDIRRTVLSWNLLVWAASAFILAPISSAALGLGLFRGGEIVIGNEELLEFALSPLGMLYIVLAGVFAAASAVIRFAGTFRAFTDHRTGHRPSLFRTSVHVAGQWRRILSICLTAVVLAGLLLAPLLLGIQLIYATLLSEFDINYYLYEQPGEWSAAFRYLVVLLIAWGVPVVLLVARLIQALPASLDPDTRSKDVIVADKANERYPPLREALAAAWQLPLKKASRLVALLGLTIGAWIGTRALFGALLLWATGQSLGMVADAVESVRILALAAGVGVLISIVVDTLIAIFGFSFVCAVITDFYYGDVVYRSGSEGYLAAHSEQARDVPGRGAAFRGALSRDTLRLFRHLRPWLRPSRAIPLAVAAVIAATYVSGVLVSRLPEPGDVMISAHRAGPPPSPENTLSALESAIAEEADFTEIDVQRTADGTVIVAHDADLMRVAGDPRRFDSSTFSELEAIVQLPDDGTPESERRLATLEEFLERSRGRIGLMIELKYYGFDAGLAPAVVEIIEELEMQDEVILMSLSLRSVQQIARLAPDIPVGYVSAAAVGDISALDVDFLAVSRARTSPALLRSSAERDIEVHAWTINDPATVAELIDRGVEGIITDYPGMAVRVRDQIAELTPPERILMRFGIWTAADPLPELSRDENG